MALFRSRGSIYKDLFETKIFGFGVSFIQIDWDNGSIHVGTERRIIVI